MPAPAAGRLVAVVGGDESQEFRRQNTLIARAWGPRVVTACEAVPGRHHMNVLNDLAYTGSRLHALARELLGLAPARVAAPRAAVH
jgi:arylformamidase